LTIKGARAGLAGLLVLVLGLHGCASGLPSPRSTGSVVSVVCARTYDPLKDKATDLTWNFLASDRQIVLGVTLKGYPEGSRCEIVRYLNGKYLDHGSVAVKKPAANTIYFTWTLTKPGVGHLPGPYRVKVFVNGRYTKEVAYTVG